jgi:hypothetical protein
MFGSSRAAYTGLVATRCFVPWLFNSTNKQVMSRSQHISRDTIASLQIVLPNWYVDNPGETFAELGTGATMTVTASVEYPAATLTQLLFSGIAAGTAATGANLVSDALSVSIPANTEFWIRIFYTNTAGIIYSTQANATLGDRIELAVSGLTDKTMSGTVNNDGPGFALPPCAIVASTQRISCMLIGTSRTGGILDTIDSSGNIGIVARSLGPGFAYTMAGIPADSAATLVVNAAKRAALGNAYFSHIVIEHGINDDVSSAPALTTLETNLQTIYAMFPTKTLYACTVDPSTTYPANTSIKDLSGLNTYLRTKPNLYGLMDMAAVMESGATGTWANIAQTVDGLHENQAGCLAIQYSGRVAI